MSEIICYLPGGGGGVWCTDEVKKKKKLDRIHGHGQQCGDFGGVRG